MSGFVGEGECEDVFWFYAFLDKVEDFFCYYSCFTGTGPARMSWMPVQVTALACEGERGMVIGDVGGKGEKGYGGLTLSAGVQQNEWKMRLLSPILNF